MELDINRSKIFDDSFFNQAKEDRDIKFLVLHHIESNSYQEAIDLLKQHKVSSHFLIDADGKIFQLVDEKNIAYHAGISYWNGVDGLNKYSIGIEFVNQNPVANNFTSHQMLSGVALCKYLISKYQIKNQNIVGHSDIAYFSDSGFLNRKQDPSHLFDWEFLAKNNIGFFPNIETNNSLDVLFSYNNKDLKILNIKESLKKIGYKISILDENYNDEMLALATVFNRKFLRIESNCWYQKSHIFLNQIFDFYNI